MILTKVKLKNFRCYQEETEFQIDDLTCIIGKNDVGKSTIIEALDAFFNDNIDKGDLSNNADNESAEITCYFNNIPEEVVLDSSVETSPIEEGILNANNQLEIRKVFSLSSRKSISIYLKGNHPNNDELSNLLSMKNAALKSFAREHEIDLEGVNKTKNPPIRAKIREHFEGGRTEMLLKVDGSLKSDDNLKDIWKSVKKWLPVYSLFKVDKSLDDKDSDVQDPMSIAVKESLALPEIVELLEKVEEAVKQKSTEVADTIIKKLKDFDKSLSEKLQSDFRKGRAWDRIFDLTLLNENNIPLNKRGSGIRRLVLLSFFQAQAEKRKSENNAPGVIYAIEEPETSQHPNHQLMLIKALKQLSKNDNVQVLFTTHSANLVREIPIKSLRFISKADGGLKVEYGKNLIDGSTDEEVIEKIIQTLGILPNPTDKVKVLLYVEGNHDVNALKQYSELLNKHDDEVLNLKQSDAIGYVITGGSSLKHYIEQKHLSGLGKPEVHIYDNDKEEYRKYVKQINEEGNKNKVAFNTTKLELENYLHQDAIASAYSDNGVLITLPELGDNDDVPHIVAEHVYNSNGGNWDDLEHEKQKDLASSRKGLLNKQAVEKMTVEYLKERSGYDEIKNWLDALNQFIN